MSYKTELENNNTDLQTILTAVTQLPEPIDDAAEINYNNISSGLTATNVQEAIDELNNKSNIQYIETTITTWTNNTYSFENIYPHSLYNIDIEPSSTATAEQFDAWCAAKIVGSSTSNTLTALGEVSTIEIPVMLKVVKK